MTATGKNVAIQKIELLHRLGLPVAEHKVQPPSNKITWLGVTFDTLSMTLYICKEKVQETIKLIQS